VSAGRRINDLLASLLELERRVDPYVRPGFDRVFRRPLVALAQALINLRRKDLHLAIAEERPLPGEEDITAAIVESMSTFTRRTYGDSPPALRAGNTKTHGLVRGRFEVMPDLPDRVRKGVFGAPRTYPAWVRFAGPGPLAPPDIKDTGILSIGIKLMGVEGPKLLDDERRTQDFTGITAPTFTTPNVAENRKLQRRILEGTPILYFLSPFDLHLLDAIMQGAYAKTQSNPLGEQYYSCGAYLLGEGQAMQYSVRPQAGERTKVPRHPSNDYLREAMAATLRQREVVFDFLVQLQTDAHRMPIEDASVVWSERRSPFVSVAHLVIPVQEFDSPAQLAFAGNLSFNPWHSIQAHRPLGNQNRARKRIYLELSKLRQAMNGERRIEPTGDEVFDGGAGLGSY
jgi:hypothetical protein